MNKYVVYTDGSFQSSIGCGGYASIICDDKGNVLKELYQGHRNTTNNREELRGVLETLKYIKEPSEIKIISDSQYVINGCQGGAKKWFEQKDYSKSNLDLGYKMLDLLEFHKVTFEGTKGHSNNIMNNRVDELAVFAARCLNLPEDEYINNCKKGGEPLVPKYSTGRSNGTDSGQENGKITYSLG